MRHHYVPQFLLRPWAESAPDGKVEVFRLDLPGLRSDRHTPEYTGYERDLWAFSRPIVAGMKKQAIEENFLKYLDDQASRVRRKLDQYGLRSLNRKDRIDWTRFVTSLRLRQPSVVSMLRSGAADHLRQTLAAEPEQYEEIAQDQDQPTLEEWTEQCFPGLIENFGLTFFHKLIDDPSVCNKIMNMIWWLWKFSSVQHDLLLADHPCIFTSGIDDQNLVIALPISPKKSFMATQSDRVASILRRQNLKHLAVRLNEASVAQTCVRIYARNTSPRRFIQNRLPRLGARVKAS